MTRREVVGAALSIALFLAVRSGAAHENAVLESPQSSIAAGAALPLSGSEFGNGQTYRLKLAGALQEYELVTVAADGAGKFSLDVAIPPDVRPGLYKLIAVASDGDEVASLDLTIAEPVPARVGEAEHEVVGESGAQHGAGMARADELSIQRSRSGAEWGVIGLVIGLAAGLGVSLLRHG